jgi:hypothetical protein
MAVNVTGLAVPTNLALRSERFTISFPLTEHDNPFTEGADSDADAAKAVISTKKAKPNFIILPIDFSNLRILK